MTVPFIRKSTQRNSSWPGDFALHPKAEYICADLSIHSSLFPCSRAADHTFEGTTGRHLSDKATLPPRDLPALVGSELAMMRELRFLTRWRTDIDCGTRRD